MRVLTLLLITFFSLFSKELTVIADSFEGDEKKGVTVFIGHVNITKGVDELNASKVTIYMNKKRVPTQYIAEGDVSFTITTETNETYVGRSQKAIFKPEEKEYLFYTDVYLSQLHDKKQIVGDKVMVNLKDGKAEAQGANKEPVIMIFQLEEEKK